MLNDLTTPDFLATLEKKLGIKVDRKTLFNYEKRGLMPTPWRSDNRIEAYHSLEAVAEFYASWRLSRGDFLNFLPDIESKPSHINLEIVSYARKAAYEVPKGRGPGDDLSLYELFGSETKEIDQLPPLDFALLFILARIWLNYKETALKILRS